jgi:hypothetical protein
MPALFHCNQKYHARIRFQMRFFHMTMAFYLLTHQHSTVHGWLHDEGHFHRKENYQHRYLSSGFTCAKKQVFLLRGGHLESSDDMYSHQSDQRRMPPPPPPPSVTHNLLNHTDEDEEATNVKTRDGTSASGLLSNTSQYRDHMQANIDGKRSGEPRAKISDARLNYEAKYYRGKGIDVSPERTNGHHYNEKEAEPKYLPTASQKIPMPPLPIQPPATHEQMDNFVENNSTEDRRIHVQKGRDSDVATNDLNWNGKSITNHHKQDTNFGSSTDDDFGVPFNVGVNNDAIKADTKRIIVENQIIGSSNVTVDKETGNQENSAAMENIAQINEFAENTPRNEDDYAESDGDYDILERVAQNYLDSAGGDNQDTPELSKLQTSIMMKSKKPGHESPSSKSISSWLMQSVTDVGKLLIKTAVSSVWTSSHEVEKSSDSFTPMMATTQMKMPKGLGSEVLNRHNQVVQLAIRGNPQDVIWKTEQKLLDHAMDLFSMYFDIWNIKCPKRSTQGASISTSVSNSISASVHESHNPISFQPSTMGTSINHAESILVSTFLSNAVSAAILKDSIMNTILPAVYNHIESYKPPPGPVRTKREKTIITKTTMTKPTILSKIDIDEDLDDIDFARLLMELECGPNEQIIEEIEYEYDEEPIFIDTDDIYEVEDHDADGTLQLDFDALIDEQVYEGEHELSGEKEGEDDTDYDDLLDDDELEVLEDARLDSSDWFSGDDDQDAV